MKMDVTSQFQASWTTPEDISDMQTRLRDALKPKLPTAKSAKTAISVGTLARRHGFQEQDYFAKQFSIPGLAG